VSKQEKQKQDEVHMEKYLKKLDDNLTTEKPDQEDDPISTNVQQEDIVWQPNIKKTRGRRTARETSGQSAGSDSHQQALLSECGKAHCRLGCICDALLQYEDNETNYTSDTNDSGRRVLEREHCGKVECMFVCNCARRLRSSNENAKVENGPSRKKKRANNGEVAGLSKRREVEEDNRRMSKRIKSAICKIKKASLNSSRGGKRMVQASMKTKSILDSSIASNKSSTNSSKSLLVRCEKILKIKV
jgi:hypothetical protein